MPLDTCKECGEEFEVELLYRPLNSTQKICSNCIKPVINPFDVIHLTSHFIIYPSSTQTSIILETTKGVSSLSLIEFGTLINQLKSILKISTNHTSVRKIILFGLPQAGKTSIKDVIIGGKTPEEANQCSYFKINNTAKLEYERFLEMHYQFEEKSSLAVLVFVCDGSTTSKFPAARTAFIDGIMELQHISAVNPTIYVLLHKTDLMTDLTQKAEHIRFLMKMFQEAIPNRDITFLETSIYDDSIREAFNRISAEASIHFCNQCGRVFDIEHLYCPSKPIQSLCRGCILRIEEKKEPSIFLEQLNTPLNAIRLTPYLLTYPSSTKTSIILETIKGGCHLSFQEVDELINHLKLIGKRYPYRITPLLFNSFQDNVLQTIEITRNTPMRVVDLETIIKTLEMDEIVREGDLETIRKTIETIERDKIVREEDINIIKPIIEIYRENFLAIEGDLESMKKIIEMDKEDSTPFLEQLNQLMSRKGEMKVIFDLDNKHYSFIDIEGQFRSFYY